MRIIYCPYKMNNPYLRPVTRECEKEECRAWEPQAKFNPQTKKYEGDCRLCMIDRKISGGINAHPY